MGMSLTDLWGAMGWFAKGIVFALFIMSLLSLWVFIERMIFYTTAKRESLRLLTGLTNVLNKREIQQAIDVTKKFRHSHISKVVGAGLLEYQATAAGHKAYDFEIVVEACRQAMERTAMITVAEFKRGLGILATVGSTAPFVGLLGTVMGIVNAFSGMATSGSGGIAAVSAGIAEALITTAFGILVAIPAVWIYNYFMNRIDRFTVEMSNSGSEMTIYFLKGVGEDNARP